MEQPVWNRLSLSLSDKKCLNLPIYSPSLNYNFAYYYAQIITSLIENIESKYYK
jgi:hypothetical protein